MKHKKNQTVFDALFWLILYKLNSHLLINILKQLINDIIAFATPSIA